MEAHEKGTANVDLSKLSNTQLADLARRELVENEKTVKASRRTLDLVIPRLRRRGVLR